MIAAFNRCAKGQFMKLPRDLLSRYFGAMSQLVIASSRKGCFVRLRPGTETELRALRDLGICETVITLYAHASLDSTAELLVRIHDPAGIVYENTMLGPGEDICPMGFPIIGSTHAGDALALDYKSAPASDGTPRVLLVSHEREWKDPVGVHKHAVVVAGSFVEFIEGVATDSYDY